MMRFIESIAVGLPVAIVALVAGPVVAQGDGGGAERAGATVEISEVRTYAGAATDELFVAFDVLVPADGDRSRPVAAYLCDGQGVSQWLSGELATGDATLASDGWTVELTVAGDRAYGTVTPADGSPRLFTALATGEGAGLFRAEGSAGGVDFVGGWIELDDGRQRGALVVDGTIVANPLADVAAGRVETVQVGTQALCCCGVAFPCSLACCAVDPADALTPDATPSPN